jgi:hypothetical protein
VAGEYNSGGRIDAHFALDLLGQLVLGHVQQNAKAYVPRQSLKAEVAAVDSGSALPFADVLSMLGERLKVLHVLLRLLAE